MFIKSGKIRWLKEYFGKYTYSQALIIIFYFYLIYQFETIMEPKKAQKYGITFMIQTSFIVPLYAY